MGDLVTWIAVKRTTTPAVVLASAGILGLSVCFALLLASLAAPARAANPPCVQTLSTTSIEAAVQRSPNRVICLRTAYFQEPGDALIVMTQPGVRVQASPSAYPIVCGKFVLRAADTSVGTDVHTDPTCAPSFNESSPWNKAASAFSAPVQVPSTWLDDFDGVDSTRPLNFANSWDHGKAIFKASATDPVTATFRIADSSQCFDDPAGCGVWQPADPTHRVADSTSPTPEHIPIPAGVRCPGLPTIDNDHDRALAVISADGKTEWDFWHCTHAATPQEPWYTAAVAAKWSLDTDDPSQVSAGYQDEGLSTTGSTSARASGTPLLPTTVTPQEAVSGIHHPLGLTVLSVSDGYVNPPASHTDGCAGCSHLRYGMLFVLRSNFKPSRFPTIGELNIIQALKRFGAYVVDQGPTFEIDGSPNEPTAPSRSDALWGQAGVTLIKIGIRASDLRYVPTPGSPPAIP